MGYIRKKNRSKKRKSNKNRSKKKQSYNRKKYLKGGVNTPGSVVSSNRSTPGSNMSTPGSNISTPGSNISTPSSNISTPSSAASSAYSTPIKPMNLSGALDAEYRKRQILGNINTGTINAAGNISPDSTANSWMNSHVNY